ncbi:MAG: hypothetical protein ACE5E5_03005 [Phycisphaerae bacterium]
MKTPTTPTDSGRHAGCVGRAASVTHGGRSTYCVVLAVMMGVACMPLRGQTADESVKHEKQARPQPVGTPVDGSPEEHAARQRFKDDLTDAVLSGTWQMTLGDGISKPVTLSDPQPESYTIGRVEPAAGDFWVINARIKYADKDVELPVLVRVIFSGDTPIITVDNLTVPMIGTYSARVMIYKGFYAGTWFGKGYGGVLSGKITKKAAPVSSKPKAAAKPSP